MRILIVASFASSIVAFRGPLIKALIAREHQVYISAPDIPDSVSAALEQFGARVCEIGLSRNGIGIGRDLRYFLALRGLMSTVKPDLVMTYTIKPNIWGAFAAASLGIPSVAMVTGLGYAFTDGATNSLTRVAVRLIARSLYRASTRRNRVVIFQNPDDRDDFIAAGCLMDLSKTRVVNGSGVDMAHYRRVPLPNAPVFLMMARLLRNKGVREYAQAAKEVLREFPQARFLLAGDFDGGPDSIDRIEVARWVEEGIEYLGALDDVRPTLAQASVYVLPSYREGTARSVLEAMAMGRPVITTDAPGCRETVKAGFNGLLVPVRDSEALAEAMRSMIKRPREIAAMGENSYQYCLDKYDVHKVNQEMLRHLGLETAAKQEEVSAVRGESVESARALERTI